MNKLTCVLFFIGICISNTYSQNSFLKIYDFGSVEKSYQIISNNDRYYINTATYCGAECSFLTEIDSAGEILWRTENPDIDIASGSMIVTNDTITVTGNNDPLNTAFRMAHFTLHGSKIDETFEIEHPTKKYSGMFQLTTQYFNNKYIICGPGMKGDTNWSLMYVVDANGLLDTLITLQPTNYQSDLWDSYIDKNGRLTTYHQVEFANSEINYRKIFKFDSNLDTVWTYTSESNDDNDVIPRGCELQDGRMIMSFANPQGSLFIHSVRAINQNGSVDWQHDYEITGSKARYILRLKCLKNGDIMGCGQYAELAAIPRINLSPWLFRMSSEGELLWERTYFDIDSVEMESRRGAFYDFIELSNGDIIATGYLKYEDDDMVIMRVDSNGCLNPKDCHEVNILTENKDIPTDHTNFELYPNPVDNKLLISVPEGNIKLDYIITDISGKSITNGIIFSSPTEINLDNFLPGIYFIHLYDKNNYLGSQKFVKL